MVAPTKRYPFIILNKAHEMLEHWKTVSWGQGSCAALKLFSWRITLCWWTKQDISACVAEMQRGGITPTRKCDGIIFQNLAANLGSVSCCWNVSNSYLPLLFTTISLPINFARSINTIYNPAASRNEHVHTINNKHQDVKTWTDWQGINH